MKDNHYEHLTEDILKTVNGEKRMSQSQFEEDILKSHKQLMILLDECLMIDAIIDNYKLARNIKQALETGEKARST